MSASCKNCRFWDKGFTDGLREYPGECRRRPPVVIVNPTPDQADGSDTTWSEWPRTHESDWCGEHEAH